MSGDAANAAFAVAGWVLMYVCAAAAIGCGVRLFQTESLWWLLPMAVSGFGVAVGEQIVGDDEVKR